MVAIAQVVTCAVAASPEAMTALAPEAVSRQVIGPATVTVEPSPTATTAELSQQKPGVVHAALAAGGVEASPDLVILALVISQAAAAHDQEDRLVRGGGLEGAAVDGGGDAVQRWRLTA